MKIKNAIKLFVQNYYLKKNNPGSQIRLLNCFNPNRISVGNGSYGDIRIICFNNKSRLEIGNYCSIAQDVKFILDADHHIDTISTYPFKVKHLKTVAFEAFGKGDIIVKDDVWIGYGASILSGITLGQGSVIAAGAVVTKDVPPYAIVGGNPARVIKYRFDENTINELLKLDFSKLNEDMIRNNIDELYKKIVSKDDIKWFLKLTRR